MDAHERGFTLIELIIGVAIATTLGVISIVYINPIELFRQARDASRLSDFSTLQHVIGSAMLESNSLGNASTVYVSIADPAATSSLGSQCQGVGLPTLPSPWTYHCAASSTFKNTDATGWLPLNFRILPGGSPISLLPVDPLNSSSSCSYYTYVTNGKDYELTSLIESSKYNPEMAKGGSYDGLYEKGSLLDLTPPIRSYGLIGWWLLNEGSGVTAKDSSCAGRNGSWSGNAVGTGGTYYTAGKDWPNAGYFDSNALDTITVPLSGTGAVTSSVSGMAWIYMPVLYSSYVIDGLDAAHHNGYLLNISNLSASLSVANGTTLSGLGTGSILPLSQWFHLAFTYSPSPNLLTLYLNGVAVSTSTPTVTMTTPTAGPTIAHYKSTGGYSNFYLNDVRIYNRTLTAAEVKAIYNAEK